MVKLASQMIGMPRHLSQHVGGFILTERPLIETVPVGNGAMPDRTFIEWDKDDIEELGILKIDVLALGMLTCCRKAFDLIEQHHGERFELATVPREVPEVYDMLCQGDSLGVFQVESRAQMNMLPRLKPRCFYDLVIEVAIVRPGPIQGDMVHPYLKRRQGKEAVTFPCPSPDHGEPDELEKILGRTLGVPIFQEQAMKIALDAARFSPAEANQLRKAMATFRSRGTIDLLQDKMVGRMVERGYDRDFAERCFHQIRGFGEYGFPESHAASFAHLVYVSSWIRWRYPAAFAAALLNSPADGLLRPGADRPRMRRSMGSRCAGGCELERLGLYLRTRPFRGRRSAQSKGPCAASDTLRLLSERDGDHCASACARSTGSARTRPWRWSRLAAGARSPMSRSCASAPGSGSRRSSGSPRPTPSARWGSTGARPCGTRGRSSKRPTCPCSSPPRPATRAPKRSSPSCPQCRSPSMW